MTAITLPTRIAELIEQHGSLRAAARVLDVDAGYLSRLQSGEKNDPGETLLRRMGLVQQVTYTRKDYRTAPTSAAGATKPNELTSSPEPAPSRASGLLPVAREGLSEERIMLISEHHDTGRAGGDYSFARAIEAAHGIAPASGDAPGEAK